jgi:hypothetical protein
MENLTFRPGILNFELEWEMKYCLPEEETGCPIVSSSADTGSQGYDEYASDDAKFSNAQHIWKLRRNVNMEEKRSIPVEASRNNRRW